MSKITMGKYYPINSIIHTLDPRSKLMGAFYFTTLVIIADDFQAFGLLMFYVIVLMFLSKIPIQILLKSIKPLLRIIIFTTLIQMLTSGGGQIYFSFSFLTVSEMGIIRSLSVLMRFLLTIFIMSITSLTTKPLELATGLGKIFTPLKIFKIDIDEIVLMITIALRFIPTLQEEFERILKAQTSRGVDFVGQTVFEKIKKMAPIFLPIFIRSFYRSKEIANALDARNYCVASERTSFRSTKWEINDTLFLLGLIFLTILY